LVVEDNRIKLGIEALDHILEPGIIKGSVLLIAGNPGAGKTTLAAHIMYNNIVKYSGRGVYISFAETENDFYKFIGQLGLDFKSLHARGLFKFVTLLSVSDIDIVDKTIEAIMEAIDDLEPSIIVIDGFTALTKILSPPQLRAFLHTSLIPLLKQHVDLSMIITDLPIGSKVVGYGIEEFIVDGVILMKLIKSYTGYERVMELRKIRGVPLNIYEVPYVIKAGIKPLLIYTDEISEKRREKIVTGINLLDQDLHGILRGSQILLTGVSGSGKSVLATYISGEAAKRGNKVLFVSLDETYDFVRGRFRSLGYDEILNDKIILVCIDPLTHNLSEVLNLIDEEVSKENPDIVVLDGVRVLYRLSNKRLFWLGTHRLTNIFRKKNIVAIYTYTADYPHERVPIDTLVDVIFALKLEIMGDRVARSFIVWKNRHGYAPSQKMKIVFGRDRRLEIIGGGG